MQQYLCDVAKAFSVANLAGRFDVVVVGAGSAGATLAARLSEDSNRSVLLLEAGPDYPDPNALPDEIKHGFATGFEPSVLNHVRTYSALATEAGVRIPILAGRVTGGGSAINGQVFLRGVPADYDLWAAAGNDLWAFEHVLPSLRRLETDRDYPGGWHGSSGPMVVHRYRPQDWLPAQTCFQDACLEGGHPLCPDLNHPDALGVGPIPLNNPDGVRWSTAIAYLPSARARSNFTLVANCEVRRVLLEGTRAIGVEALVDGRLSRVEASEVVLSAGALESPMLLMRSGIGAADRLRSLGVKAFHDLQGVGCNLQDHPVVKIGWTPIADLGVDARVPRMQVLLRYTSEGTRTPGDMKITPQNYVPAPGLPAAFVIAASILGPQAVNGQLSPVVKGGQLIADLDLRLLASETDRRRLREGLRLSERLGSFGGFRALAGTRLTPGDDDLASDSTLDAWMLRTVTSAQHPCGTCRMGPGSSQDSVVDQHCRVHGVDGLRVVDASIMPTIVSANLNLTAILIGERAAELMRAELPSQSLAS